jgi:sigma-B regulation protein RsbU (phosphoserine phosphatase)
MAERHTESQGHAQGLLRTLRGDVSQVMSDLQRRGVHRSINAARDEAEAFYLDEASRQRLAGMNVVSREIRRIFWLLKSLLFKLTPTRRVLLALAIVMLTTWINYDAERGWIGSVQLPTFGAVLIGIVLMLELKDKLVARNELVAGRAVQLALMPPASPVIPGWDVWLYTEPANDVGGDLVDHLPLGDGRHGIALGDVAGKALPAALLMVKLQATIRALAPESLTLDVLGESVNRILHRDGLPNRFATMVYMVLSEYSGTVRYLLAGHLPPLVVRGSNIEALAPGSMAFGFIAEARFTEETLRLDTGEVLVAFSDGVLEATNGSEEFFGEERLTLAVRSASGLSAKAIGERVLSALTAFVGENRPYDDVSIVVVRKA